VSVSKLCGKVAMSRQNYYKLRSRRRRLEIDEELVLQLVRSERSQQPRLGTRKLHKVISPSLADAGVSIGRDRLFGVLRTNDLLVPPPKRTARTTNSRHSLPVFRNLIKDLVPEKPNEVWVSDITYIRTVDSFVYLALVMDLYSRKIVGYHCGDSLEAIGAIRALEMALRILPDGMHPIHHSDRGCQYCCHAYVDRLRSAGMPISMTEEMHCYENANAERLNGILKQEYGLDNTFRNKRQASEAVEQAVHTYNTRRPHMALNYRVPEEVHANAA